MKKNLSENITQCSKKGKTMKTIGTALTRSILRTACTHKGLQTFTKTKKCIDCTEEISGTAYLKGLPAHTNLIVGTTCMHAKEIKGNAQAQKRM